jgi:hypothetical protein
MFTPHSPETKNRWPRGQRFGLSPAGLEADLAYRTAVAGVRSMGREALTLAERRWADPLGVAPTDGVVMAEIRPGRRSLADLSSGLDACGMPAAQIRESVARLVEKGLVAPQPLSLTAA